MAVQNPTTNYGFVLPVPGQDTGSWGPKLRAIYGEVMDSIDTVANDLQQMFSALNADGLTSGTIDDDRIVGAYRNIQDLTCNGVITDTGLVGKQLGNVFRVRQIDASLSAGTHHNLDVGDCVYRRFFGVGAKTITGFSGGENGRYLLVHNAGTDEMTINVNDGGSSAGNRVIGPDGVAEISLPASHGIARFIYDDEQPTTGVWRWIPASVSDL